MKFNEGDKIAYPMNGAGVIESIEEKSVLGKLHKYYILNIPTGNLRLMIPVDNASRIGARRIVSKQEAEKIVSYFNKIDFIEEQDEGWNRRYRKNMEKLKKGELIDIAYVAKTLYLRDKKRTLSTAERKMLMNAKLALVTELALVNNENPEEWEKKLFEEEDAI